MNNLITYLLNHQPNILKFILLIIAIDNLNSHHLIAYLELIFLIILLYLNLNY